MAPIIPYSATLHTGYANFELIDGVVWCYINGIGLLRDAFRTVRVERPFTIDAIVILPDHLHAIWTLAARRNPPNAVAI